MNFVQLKITEEQEAIDDFFDLWEDADTVTTHDGATQILEDLQDVRERVLCIELIQRVDALTRMVIEKRASLPFECTLSASKWVQEAERLAPDCPDCGREMTLKTPDGGYFWGCAEFPECWGQRQIGGEISDGLLG